MAKVWAIVVKGEEQGVDGVNMYRWATDEQLKSIMEMLQDPTRQNAWITLGGRPLQISRIKDFKPMELGYAKTLPSFSTTLLQRIEEEKQLGIGDWDKELLENPEGKKRLEELKSQFRLGGGE